MLRLRLLLRIAAALALGPVPPAGAEPASPPQAGDGHEARAGEAARDDAQEVDDANARAAAGLNEAARNAPVVDHAGLDAAVRAAAGVDSAAESAAVLDAGLEGRTRASLDTLVARALPAPGESVRVVEIGRDAHSSHHLVGLRSGETPHRHDRHDLTVVMLRGHGSMRQGDETLPVGEGSILYVPRGRVHAFTNEASEPAVAYVVYHPPYDGRDAVPVEAPASHVEAQDPASHVEAQDPASHVEAQDPATGDR